MRLLAFRWTARGGYQPPKAFSLLGRRCRAYARLMRWGRNGKSPSAGRPVSGPYERAGDLCIRRRGGTLGRPPYPPHSRPRHNKGAFKKGSARFSTTARPAAAKDEESSQLSHRAFALISSPNWCPRKNGVRGKRSMGTRRCRQPAAIWVLSHRWERTSPKRRNILATVKETLSSPPHPAPSGPPSPGELAKKGRRSLLQARKPLTDQEKDLTRASGSGCTFESWTGGGKVGAAGVDTLPCRTTPPASGPR